jgi:hypothetical protein
MFVVPITTLRIPHKKCLQRAKSGRVCAPGARLRFTGWMDVPVIEHEFTCELGGELEPSVDLVGGPPLPTEGGVGGGGNAGGRDLHSSTVRLVVSTFVGYARWLHGISVTKTAQVELRSGRV